MTFDHVAIGGGLIGLTSTMYIVNQLIKIRSKKKYKIAIIDENISNIPGGVAYGKENSRHGYFNNPLRLSPRPFREYYSNINNFLKIKDYIYSSNSTNDIQKFHEIIDILKTKDKKKIGEIYLPRSCLAFWHEKLIFELYKKINKRVSIIFLQGKVLNLSHENKIVNILAKNKIKEYRLKINDNKNIYFEYSKKKFTKSINGKYVTVGLGLLPPKKLHDNSITNRNYFWDFYKEGSTKALKFRIENILQKKNIIKIAFIGSKAGFLESLTEIYSLISNSKKKIKISCFSKNFQSLQPAILSEKKFNIKYFNPIKNKIFTAKDIFNQLIKEFKYQKKFSIKKYDVWTKILKLKYLDFYLKSLNSKQKEIYNSLYFDKIRNITRFTFPETIKIKNKMLQKKIIRLEKHRAEKVRLYKNFILLETAIGNYKFDIVINVTGPQNVLQSKSFCKIINSLNFISKNTKPFFDVDKDFILKNSKQIFVPGVIANGFNPSRKTIINSLFSNSIISSKKIIKLILSE